MISIIIPYKNDEAFIGRCVESLIRQHGDFEFIFVDDSSTDKGKEIVTQYAESDDRFVIIDNQRKAGVSGARNTGLSIAHGEWITFLDADDTMSDDAYKQFAKAIRIGRDHSIFQFNHYRHYAKSGKTALKYTNISGLYDISHLPVLWCCVWNKLYRADLIKDLRFNETMQFGEDELFNMDCFVKEKRIRCFDAVTITHYYENTESLSKTRTEKDILKMSRVYEDFIKKHKEADLRRAVCLRLSSHWSNLYLKALTGEDHG